MEIQASRRRARTARDGEPVLLLDQDRSRWDRLLIRRGLAALAAPRRSASGPYGAAGRDRRLPRPRATAAETDWVRIAALYEALAALDAVAGGRAQPRRRASAMAFGPEAGAALRRRAADEPALASYHLLPSVRADLLAKLGRIDEARAEWERAAALTENAQERELLLADLGEAAERRTSRSRAGGCAR